MKRISISAFILIILFPLDISALPDFFDNTDPDILLEEIISSMDNTELLGQTLLLGYYGLDPSQDILEWITEKKIGGVKIFGWNVSNLERLGKSISLMQRKASLNNYSIPLFVATDQEGGWVRHVKGNTSITPGNMSIGATSAPVDAYRTGLYIGRELKTLGINMNFAPTVDIYTNPREDVIGPRAFSSDPLTTASLSTSFFQGQESTGVISTAKHFPGHGAARGDSHGMLPRVSVDYDTFWNRELLPYRFLIIRDIPAIMSGHISFPEITGRDIAASKSPFLLTELLRGTLGFSGIIITDDMVMDGAVIGSGTIERACYEAIMAGNDILMISRTTSAYNRIWDYLYPKMTGDEQFRQRITDSVRRILKTKIDYFKRDNSVALYPDIEAIKNTIPSPEGSRFFLDQAFRSVSIVRAGELPVTIGEETRVLLAAPYRTFLREGQKQIPQADTYYFPFIPEKESKQGFLNEFAALVKNYDRVIFSLANKFSLEMLEILENSSTEVTVISSLTPIYLEDVPWVNSAVAVYGTGYESYMAGFAAILGEYIPRGTVPINSMDIQGFSN